MMSIRKLGLPTCWAASLITRITDLAALLPWNWRRPHPAERDA
jgi:hypothetical protein